MIFPPCLPNFALRASSVFDLFYDEQHNMIILIIVHSFRTNICLNFIQETSPETLHRDSGVKDSGRVASQKAIFPLVLAPAAQRGIFTSDKTTINTWSEAAADLHPWRHNEAVNPIKTADQVYTRVISTAPRSKQLTSEGGTLIERSYVKINK